MKEKNEILAAIEENVLKRMAVDSPLLETQREGFIALAVLMDAIVAFDAKKKEFMYVLIQQWLDDCVSDDLYEALAHVNGARIEPEEL